DAERDQRGAADGTRPAARAHERHQREDASLSAVVGAHDEDEILERDDDRQRPEDQREDADDVLASRRYAMVWIEALTQRVQRARADVAVDHSQRREREREEIPAAVLLIRGI